jgi:hypothetical protein
MLDDDKSVPVSEEAIDAAPGLRHWSVHLNLIQDPRHFPLRDSTCSRWQFVNNRCGFSFYTFSKLDDTREQRLRSNRLQLSVSRLSINSCLQFFAFVTLHRFLSSFLVQLLQPPQIHISLQQRNNIRVKCLPVRVVQVILLALHTNESAFHASKNVKSHKQKERLLPGSPRKGQLNHFPQIPSSLPHPTPSSET